MAETTNNAIIENGPVPSNDIWSQFGIPSIDLAEDINVDCDNLGGLAGAVLDAYSIGYSDEANAGEGGELDYMDIKRMDAMTVLNWSLIQAGAENGDFVEPIVNADGEVEFRAIGGYSGEIEDVYYEIVAGSYSESPTAVMVTGGRPLPTVKPLKWYPVWGENPVRIYTPQDMFDNCRKKDFIRHASIVFNDPQLTTAYDDGVDNLYEINSDNPWDRVIGYVKYINPGPLATKDTAISYDNTATVPIQIGNETAGSNGPDMGTFVDKPTFKSSLYDPSCWEGAGEAVDYTSGVKVNIPDELRYTTKREVEKDKFLRVSAVYAIGKRIQTMTFAPRDESASTEDPTPENAKLIVSIEESDTTTVKLEPGKHYAVAYEELGSTTGKIPYIVFVKDILKGDPFNYGKDQAFYPDPTCQWAIDNNLSETDEQQGTIFPHTRSKGLLVQDLWVTVDLETPCINVYDPGVPTDDSTGANALQIAQNMEYYISPIVMVEPPAPIAYAGPSTGYRADLVDQVPSTDNDPTTVEDMQDRELELYIDEMQGGGMAITWSFLDEDTVMDMCDVLYNHFKSDVIETIYTCGPECNPKLGGYGDSDGVINAIRYNYTDSGSYTVSVTEGPKLVGNLAQVDGGPSMKMAENFSASGVIIDKAGDNIHFKVRIDGYGERWAVNMTHRILRIGDIIQCTVHNNPVEA